jgi:DNA-binding transcriptional regulator YhcF (GntR family)
LSKELETAENNQLGFSKREEKKQFKKRLKFLNENGFLNRHIDFMSFIKEDKKIYIRAENTLTIDIIPYPVRVLIENGTSKEDALELLKHIVRSIEDLENFDFYTAVLKDD